MPTQPAVDRLLHSIRAADERGDSLLHLQLEVATIAGQQSSWGSSDAGVASDETVGQFISHVESLGWTLQHVGYSFVETGSSTSAKVFSTGEGRVNQGIVIGFFTFRRVTPGP